MPTKPKRYPSEIPKTQFQVLREIALAGQLSNHKLKERMEVTHAVVSEAIKVLKDRNMVKASHIENAGHKGGKPEQYYALTKEGLNTFIKRNPAPAPEEFFQALLKSYNLRQQSLWLKAMSSEDLKLYYNSYKIILVTHQIKDI